MTDLSAQHIIVSVEPVTVDIATACTMLGIGKSMLLDMVAAGELNARKLRTRTVFNVEDLKKFAASLPSWEPKS